MQRTLPTVLATVVLVLALGGLSGCYATHASVGVGYEVPPAPAYYDVEVRPGYTFIEGRWVWTSQGWQWYPGYWVAARPGYVYVQGYWDYWGGSWAYRPGTWSRYRSGHVWIGGRWQPHRSGHYYDYRRGNWVWRQPHVDRRPPARGRPPAVRDHRTTRPPPHGSSRSAPDRSAPVRRRDRR
jgi:hypothetical protein